MLLGNSDVPVYKLLTVQFDVWENSWLALMRNSIDKSYDVNLILNTYTDVFFIKLLLRIFDVVWKLRPGHARMQDESSCVGPNL